MIPNMITYLYDDCKVLKNLLNIQNEAVLNSEQTILVNQYHNEILVSNPEISGIFTIDLKNIPEEYLKKAQEEDLPIIVFAAEK